jgi:SAM-dependent MidA family methyltransferase
VRSWGEAWQDALYGDGGFFLRERPLDHFATQVTNPVFVEAVLRLAHEVDAALGFPDPFDLVDVGAGRGELLLGLGEVPERWQLTGVDVAAADVPFAWRSEIPTTRGLLIAHEWLDAIPLDVVEGGRLVLVDPAGQERLGGSIVSPWADRWWPGTGRVEIGDTRDRAWATAVSRVRAGLAVAIDYGHTRADRRPTLTGYRDGHQVAPVPDGSCDLTAHVALDSCADAAGSLLVPQDRALRALGVDATLPARGDPGYAAALARASQARQLLDPDGWGGFGWLVHPVEITPAGWMTG